MEIEFKSLTVSGNWKKEVSRRNMFGWRCYKASGYTEITRHTEVSEGSNGIEINNYNTEEKKTDLCFKRPELSLLKKAAVYTLEITYRLTIVLLWPLIAAVLLSAVAAKMLGELGAALLLFSLISLAVLIPLKIVVFILSKKIPRLLGYDVRKQV